MRRVHKSKERSDDGFTLIELIVVVVLLGLVVGVISAAIVVIFRSETGAVRLVAESHDTQQGVNYFPLDVQAGPLDVAAYDVSSGAAGCVPEGVNVLQFDKGDKRVAYRLVASGTTARLDRHVCDYPLLTNLQRRNIADELDATDPQPAVATPIAAGLLVESIELRLAQVGDDALLVASPRGEPRNSPGDCQTSNPLDATNGYGVFVEGDVDLAGGEVTGWVGLGGDLAWLNNISIATGNMSAVTPAYGLFAEGVDWQAIYRSGAKAVTNLNVASNVATATVAGHGYLTGQLVELDATNNPDIDENAFAITVTGTDTFTFAVTTADATGMFGTVRDVDAFANLDVLGNVATVTMTGHGYSNGDQVAIEGTLNSDIDDDVFVVTVIDVDTFSFPVLTADVSSLTGTARTVTPAVLDVEREKAAIGGPFDQDGDDVYEVPLSMDNYLTLSGPGNPPAESTAAQIDFPLNFDELRDCSAQIAQLLDICALAGCANEVDVTVTAPVINACASNPVPQVLNVPESFFDGLWQFDTSGSGCQGFSQVRPLILNVIDDGDGIIEIDATPVDWTALGDRKNILFNFPNATTVRVRDGFYGHILAPFADVTTYGLIEGGIVAREWTHIGGTVDSNDDLYNNPISWP